MQYLLIGGAGYIGSHTSLELLRKNQQVIILDNLSTGNSSLINSAAKFYEGDFHSSTLLEQIFKENKIDVVINFAASIVVSESVKNPLKYYYNNVSGIITLLQAMEKFSVKKLIFSSTAAVYGEVENGKAFETGPKNPINPYGASKMMCERIIIDYAQTSDLNYGILRYFNVSGADSSGQIGLIPKQGNNLTHLIPSIADYLAGNRKEFTIFGNDFKTKDGTCIRDYVHVSDLALAHISTAEYICNKQANAIFNVGSNNGYSNLEVLRTFEKVLDHKIDFKFGPKREGDPAILIADTTAIRQALNFNPKHNLEDMIKSELSWRIKLAKQK